MIGLGFSTSYILVWVFFCPGVFMGEKLGERPDQIWKRYVLHNNTRHFTEKVNMLIVLYMLCKSAITFSPQGTRPVGFIICQLNLISALRMAWNVESCSWSTGVGHHLCFSRYQKSRSKVRSRRKTDSSDSILY